MVFFKEQKKSLVILLKVNLYLFVVDSELPSSGCIT